MKVLGTGSFLPKTVYDNEYMESIVETSDEWIRTRTGIEERHILQQGRSTDMAISAGKAALESAGLAAKDLGAIICATITPDNYVPSMACEVLTGLGAACPALDVNAACTGFLYGMKIATAFGESGKPVLVIGAETLSKITDYTDRSTCILFGDAAGAAVLGPGEGISYIEVNALGDPEGLLVVPGIDKSVGVRSHYISMQGQEVFKFATRQFATLTRRALEATGLEKEDLALVIPHQANIRIIEYAMKKLGLPREKFMINIEGVGNTSSASIPVALDQANRMGRIKQGDKVLLLGFGGGLTSGVAVVEWQ